MNERTLGRLRGWVFSERASERAHPFTSTGFACASPSPRSFPRRSGSGRRRNATRGEVGSESKPVTFASGDSAQPQ